MSNMSVNVRVVLPRMMSLQQAAEYVGMPAKRFPGACPVSPVQLPGGVKKYDRADIDKWIDDLKGGEEESDEDILERLE